MHHVTASPDLGTRDVATRDRETRGAVTAVTGACGFIGANIVLHLANAGHRVIACDLDPPPEPLSRAWSQQSGPVRWIPLDVTEESGWGALDGEPVERIIHGAAVTPGGEDQAPGRTARVNLGGTIAGLDYARRRQCRRFVFISSSGVYGAVRSSKPLLETRVVSPNNSYALAKLCGERFVSLYRERYGLDACAVRLAAPYGPWERPTGARPRMSPVFRLATAALRGQALRVSGLTVARDWTYVEDVAAAIVHLATLSQVPFDLFNLSAGVPVSLAQIVQTVQRLHPAAAIRTSRANTADVVMSRGDSRTPLDISRLRSTGFVATTALEIGLTRYLDWLNHAGRFVL
ncbi:MAG: NAD-dependent epimerase/dehydratase family protein [Armatimonadota bacterium]